MKPYFGMRVNYRMHTANAVKPAVVVRVHGDTCVDLVVEGEQLFRTSVVLGTEAGQFQFQAE